MRSGLHRAVTVVMAMAVLGLSSCASVGEDGPFVVVSTNILGDVVEEVVGDQAEVLTLMPPNTDPHSFGISAQVASRIRSADLLVSNGLGLEEGLQDHLDLAASEGVPTFVAGDVIDVLDYAEGEAAGTPDPHFWTDPGRMIDVVDALTPVLAAIEGVQPEAIAPQSDAYRAELERLETEMAAAFTAIPAARRALVTNHHVFGYLAESFDFEIVGAVIPGGTTLASPSAADMVELADAIQAAGVPAIFAESSSPDRLVRALADEADLRVEVHSLFSESLSGPEGDAPDYLSMMRANTARIASGLPS